jgi:cobalt-zinc-cadmium efflux system membrane fusion protein
MAEQHTLLQPTAAGPVTADRRALLQQVGTGAIVVVAACALLLFLVTPAREAVLGWFKHDDKGGAGEKKPAWPTPVELIKDKDNRPGLRLSELAMKNLEVNPTPVQVATREMPLPPQQGQVNYDIDYIYSIRPRFNGEIVSFHQVEENLYPEGPPRKRDLTWNDKVKQGEVLAVFWSKELGLAKAALVDAIVNKAKSQVDLEKAQELLRTGSISEAAVRAAEKQYRNDLNAYHTALYPLYVWKLPPDEIQAVQREADAIQMDPNKPRNPEEEIKRWARVEIKAPVFARDKDGNPDPTRALVVLEKNTNYEFVDPGRDTPLFRLADLTRLQIWIHPPESTLPLLRDSLNRPGSGLKLQARFLADPPGTEPMTLKISKIAPSIEPNLKTPMVIAELDNPDRRFLVGQFVEALIYLPPPPDTVEVPTDAVNLVESQSLVFVRPADGKPNEFYLRRVAVAQTAGKVTLVRSKLTKNDEEYSRSEVQKKRRPLETLQPGDIVLTRGVVELTAKLDDMQTSPEGK